MAHDSRFDKEMDQLATADGILKHFNNHQDNGAKTPQYIVQCKEFFSSEVDGFENNSTPCLAVKVGSSRLATYDASGELSGDGTISIRKPVIAVKYGSWAPIMQDYLFNGKKLENINFKRFISINGTKIVIQELNYQNCLLNDYAQHNDIILFSFGFVIVEDVNISYDHEGKKIGNTGTIFNSSTLQVKASS